MNKLKEYKVNESLKYLQFWEDGGARPDIDQGWEDGFDAAIALDLPVKFAEWKEGVIKVPDYRLTPVKYKYWVSNGKEFESLKDLFQYWLDNVYKPE